jgi:hypothetical protein
MKYALAALLTLGALVPAAHAGPTPPTPELSELCVTIPSVYVGGQPVTPQLKPCIPWI